jgi:hypothetical protein
MYNDELNMNDEECEANAAEFTKNQIEIQKKIFIEGCYEAYDLLTSKGKEALAVGELSAICSAIDRMTALFLLNEEYERCKFLKEFASANIPGYVIVPDKNVEIELLK